MEIFQAESLIHFLLFLSYFIFAYSIATRGKYDPFRFSVALFFFFISIWALGKTVMHNAHTSQATAQLVLNLTTPFNLMFTAELLIFSLLLRLGPDVKKGTWILFAGNILFAIIAIVFSAKGIFIVEKISFGWLAVNNPGFNGIYNLYIFFILGGFLFFMIPAIKTGSPFVKKQAILISVVATLTIAGYYIIPNKSFLDNSADLLAFPLSLAYYHSIRIYGMFDFSPSEAARAVFDNVSEYVLLTGIDGKIFTAGRLFTEKFHSAIDSKNNIKDFFSSRASIDALIAECLYEGSVKTSQIILEDGTLTVPVNVSATLIKRAKVPIAIAWIIADITEAKAFEERLKRYNEELEIEIKKRTGQLITTNVELAQTNEDLEYFAYASYHDLREPLRQISINLDFLEEKLTLRDPEVSELFGYVKEGAARMMTLLTDIRNYTAIRKNKYPEEKVNLNECVNRAIDTLETEIREKQAVIEQEPLPVTTGSKELFTNVFKNLISNAIKYNKNKPLIKIYAEANTVCVADNGIGIDPKYYEKIFVIFERLHSIAEYPGTGAGLAICKKTVDLYRGRIYVKPGPGGGSIFAFTLPATGDRP